ncbi:2-(5''-triphosphoribosyl)-3'-dephosphocoenzyme-A synthase [Marinobacterium nitratireducens]|uniref:Probable 2-(5''-triphosphoribosyl)-3'-dephosphocoenzyme-A synthase n=1 Tax=Marinobacterium nitratireducens TaxID=518897 RepID=A0A917ZMB4_9GAMM|nr:triphosphoribosyl-dephospho-CoA synthase [Marinobacterium nitratireducens]GGO86447.1 2-(5''-triphosphoribosyl)-3'-dephosphocoenzyme-A synthase [Marinobacterium nitratireducens]
MQTAIQTAARTATPAPLARPAEVLGDLACWALEQEARLSPKPALVDSRGAGAHSDMNLSLMLASAQSLRPWFAHMAQAAIQESSVAGLRRRIGQLGREAEAAMMAATAGINTHRGAIWALGLLVTAAATHSHSLAALLDRAAQLARQPDPDCPAGSVPSNGQRVCREYRLPGAREQAQQGFPHLLQRGLPTLRQSRESGDSESVSRLNALLAIMSALTDTCVLSRAGLAGLEAMQQGARAVLDAGGCGTFSGRRELAQYEQRLLSLGASAGGAADLLAATLFVDRHLGDANR